MNHKKYIGVDVWPNIIRFQAPGTEFYESYIDDFISNNKFDIDSTFAICSYVPDRNNKNKNLIKETFNNVYIFYPYDNKIKINI